MGGLEYVLDELSLHQYKDIITAKTGFVYLNMRQSRPPLVYFRPFHITFQIQIEKSIDGVRGIRTLAIRMAYTDGLTAPPPLCAVSKAKISNLISHHKVAITMNYHLELRQLQYFCATRLVYYGLSSV